ncbi:hypothetical protein GQ457_07G016600 [Hibiscus cannabinus]
MLRWKSKRMDDMLDPISDEYAEESEEIQFRKNFLTVHRLLPTMIEVSSTTSPFFKPHKSSAVDPATLFTKNSNAPVEAANDGGDAMARKEGFSTSGSRNWRYCPGKVCEATRSGEFDTSMLTWKRDSAAISIDETGDGIQTVVSWRTAARVANRRRGRRWRGVKDGKGSRRRIDMGRGGALKGACGTEGVMTVMVSVANCEGV